jgi:Rieske Fe-S protein
LGGLSDFKMNTLTWLQDRDLFVLRNHEGIGTFSCRCTHLGCMVRRTAEGFVCPCHGAEYGPLGEVISGPARRPLPWYRVWLARDGRLWVNVGKPLDEAGPTPVVLPQGNRA